MLNDFVSKQAVIDIIHKEIERTNSYTEHETQINIEIAVKALPCAYDVEKVVEDVRVDCCSMGFDESQVEIIVADIRNGRKE